MRKNFRYPNSTKSLNTSLFSRVRKWWEAVVIFESYGKRSIGLYLWQKREDVWKRKHKFNVRNLEEWNKLKNAIEQLAPKLAVRQ